MEIPITPSTPLTSESVGESRHGKRKLRELRMIVADFKNLSPYRAHTTHWCCTALLQAHSEQQYINKTFVDVSAQPAF